MTETKENERDITQIVSRRVCSSWGIGQLRRRKVSFEKPSGDMAVRPQEKEKQTEKSS